MNRSRHDILTREDLEALLAEFYARLLADDRVSSKFEGIDMPSHLPRIVDFWHNLLHQARCYTGNPFDPHLPLDLHPEHFQVWLTHFDAVIDEWYEGPVAEDMKKRAHHIGSIFAWKLQTMRGDMDSPPPHAKSPE